MAVLRFLDGPEVVVEESHGLSSVGGGDGERGV